MIKWNIPHAVNTVTISNNKFEQIIPLQINIEYRILQDSISPDYNVWQSLEKHDINVDILSM